MRQKVPRQTIQHTIQVDHTSQIGRQQPRQGQSAVTSASGQGYRKCPRCWSGGLGELQADIARPADTEEAEKRAAEIWVREARELHHERIGKAEAKA